MLKKPELFGQGFHLASFSLPEKIKQLVKEENWSEVDSNFKLLTARGGELFEFLQNYHDFNSIEFIISIRDAANEWEEDGIWHDDGSRVFAFSLSLTLGPEDVEGGYLGVRRKEEINFDKIATQEFGKIILFLTGTHGFEHKIHQVTAGRRIIIAGWCS